ncbi:hypothetical protein ACJ2A9_17155 [Anaerobacillus sp. MEB173]|uniref:hypothetical protein n=1 Tax=Anaerobacillus sp. MEB173 TaxID=3383345 RepID=UPI003F90139D
MGEYGSLTIQTQQLKEIEKEIEKAEDTLQRVQTNPVIYGKKADTVDNVKKENNTIAPPITENITLGERDFTELMYRELQAIRKLLEKNKIKNSLCSSHIHSTYFRKTNHFSNDLS